MTLTKQTLNALVANGKTGQAIEELLTLSSQLDKDLQEEILIQSAKFKSYQKEKRQETSSKEELQITLSKINHALLEIIYQLPDDKLVIVNFRWDAILKWAGTIAAIIAFLAAIAEFSGYSLRDIFFTGKPEVSLQDTTQQMQDTTQETTNSTTTHKASNGRQTKSQPPSIPLLKFKGVVKDSDEEPLQGVHISIGSEEVLSDSQGRFKIQVDSSAKGIQIYAHKKGYANTSQTHYISADNIKFTLTKKENDY